jgi:hypothetical protein
VRAEDPAHRRPVQVAHGRDQPRREPVLEPGQDDPEAVERRPAPRRDVALLGFEELVPLLLVLLRSSFVDWFPPVVAATTVAILAVLLAALRKLPDPIFRRRGRGRDRRLRSLRLAPFWIVAVLMNRVMRRVVFFFVLLLLLLPPSIPFRAAGQIRVRR